MAGLNDGLCLAFPTKATSCTLFLSLDLYAKKIRIETPTAPIPEPDPRPPVLDQYLTQGGLVNVSTHDSSGPRYPTPTYEWTNKQ